MKELPVGTSFREAIYLASTVSSEQDSIYESAQEELIEKKFAGFDRERIEINGQLYYKYSPIQPSFINPTDEPIVPFARNKLGTIVPKFFIIEGKH